MDRAKAIELIRKCMALSESPEPHEASTALHHMQKLMKKFEVTDGELGLIEYGKIKVHVPLQVNRKAVPLVLAELISICMDSIGVKAIIAGEKRVSDYSYVVTYYGHLHRIEIAKHVHEVLYRACTVAWDQSGLSSKHKRGAKASFQLGWLMRVKAQVPAMVFDQEDIDRANKMIEDDVPDAKTTETSKTKLHRGYMSEGYASAKDFQLNRPIA